MTQRLISALLEENIVTSMQDTMESEGQGIFEAFMICFLVDIKLIFLDENSKSSGMKAALNGPQAAALERRIRQELEEQGILTADEANISQVKTRKNLNVNVLLSKTSFIKADDEILTELRRCQGELKAISQHNLKQLKRLYRLSQDEMKRQETRKKLIAADAEVRFPSLTLFLISG